MNEIMSEYREKRRHKGPVEFTVRIRFSVDQDRWADEYGMDATTREIAADAREHLTATVDDYMQNIHPLGYLFTATVE